MPQTALPGRPSLTLPICLAMWVLRSYPLVAVLLLIIEAVESSGERRGDGILNGDAAPSRSGGGGARQEGAP